MATCNKEQKTVFVLGLTQAEADVLMTLLRRHIVGTVDGPRGVLNGVSAALFDAGAKHIDIKAMVVENSIDRLQLF